MRRRAVLTALAGGVASLSGCQTTGGDVTETTRSGTHTTQDCGGSARTFTKAPGPDLPSELTRQSVRDYVSGWRSRKLENRLAGKGNIKNGGASCSVRVLLLAADAAFAFSECTLGYTTCRGMVSDHWEVSVVQVTTDFMAHISRTLASDWIDTPTTATDAPVGTSGGDGLPIVAYNLSTERATVTTRLVGADGKVVLNRDLSIDPKGGLRLSGVTTRQGTYELQVARGDQRATASVKFDGEERPVYVFAGAKGGVYAGTERR